MGVGYTKKEIMDAVVEVLRPLSAAGGGYIRQLEARGLDEWHRDRSDETLRLPAVIVSFSSSSYSPGQYGHIRETVGFEVAVAVLAGVGRGPETVLEDIRRTLCGSDLGLGIGPVMPVRETPLEGGAHRVCFSALYSVAQQVPVTD